MFTVDRNVHETGGRGFFWLRNVPMPDLPLIFKKSSSYQLDSNRNYLFCCYPHGILSIGVAIPFIFEKGGFKNIFPNHNPYLTTMHETYYFPFFRETPLAFNCCSASERSLNYLLSKKNGGNAVALIVGGSDEIGYSHKEDYHIILKRRKGFARVALKMVPQWIKSVTGINLNLSYGQGVFHNWYGVVPFIKPVNTIVG
ncbi:hypothetical protein FQR65_LT07171 [Abscondita terminalis]|nr:hypothetical protein FQR65_LT07171 [Abscondita terminalis]